MDAGWSEEDSAGTIYSDDDAEAVPQAVKASIVKRGLRRMRDADFDHDHAALQNGDYAATQYNNRYQAELALANDYRFWFRGDTELVELALEITAKRNSVTSFGMTLRAWLEDYAHYRQMVYSRAAEPENYRAKSDKAEVNRKQNESTQQEIRLAFHEHIEELFQSAAEAEIFVGPADLEEYVSIGKQQLKRQMRQMAMFEEMDDPTQSGRGRRRKVFEYHPEKEEDGFGQEQESTEESGDSTEVVARSPDVAPPSPTATADTLPIDVPESTDYGEQHQQASYEAQMQKYEQAKRLSSGPDSSTDPPDA